MMRKLVVITTLLLLTIITGTNVLSAQNKGIAIPITTIVLNPDNVNVPYNGKWGWHKVHMRPLKRFLLESPLTSSRKIDVCFKCHQKNDYRICDPHNQLDSNGKILVEKCLYCHSEKPDEKLASFSKYRLEVKFNRDIEDLCSGCHSSSQYKLLHPLNANHLRKPSDEMLSMMKKTEEQFGVIFPLNYDGKIMCATCHNPHQKGVMPEDRGAAGGAGEKDRIRLPGEIKRTADTGEREGYMTRMASFGSKICLACHKDKEMQEGPFK